MKSKIKTIIAVLVIFSLMIAHISYAVTGKAENSNSSFMELNKTKLSAGETLEITFDLSSIKYDNFEIELSSNISLKDAYIETNIDKNVNSNNSSNTTIDDKSSAKSSDKVNVNNSDSNPNLVSINIDKTSISLDKITLYFVIPNDVNVGDSIDFLVKVLAQETITESKSISVNTTNYKSSTTVNSTVNANTNTVNNTKSSDKTNSTKITNNTNNIDDTKNNKINNVNSNTNTNINTNTNTINATNATANSSNTNTNINSNTSTSNKTSLNETTNSSATTSNNISTQTTNSKETANVQSTKTITVLEEKQTVTIIKKTDSSKKETSSTNKLNNTDENKSTKTTSKENNESKSSTSATATTQTVTYNGSGNNYLSTLKIEGADLNTNFNKENTTYFTTVKNVNSLNITATAEESTAKVCVIGADNIKTGQNKILISVTAENGNVRYYRIIVECQEINEESNTEIDAENNGQENSNKEIKGQNNNSKTSTISQTAEIKPASLDKVELHATYYLEEVYVAENQYVEAGTNILKYTNGTYLTAPYNCCIVKLDLPEIGAQCKNSNYVEVESTNILSASLKVSENNIKNLNIGKEAKIEIASLGKTYTGLITHIGSIASNGKFEVTVQFENDGNVKLGMTSDVGI